MPQQVTDSYLPYDVNTFIDQLPGYDINPMTVEMLDLSRVINLSGNYYWVGAAFPTIQQGDTFSVEAFATITGSISTPPGSYVMSFTNYSDQTEGIKLKVYDKGTKASIFYGDWAKADIVSSNMEPGLVTGEPFGPNYLISPLIVTPPGVINWEIVNLSAEDAMVQVMMVLAVPVSNRSIGTLDITRG